MAKDIAVQPDTDEAISGLIALLVVEAVRRHVQTVRKHLIIGGDSHFKSQAHGQKCSIDFT